MHDLKVAVALAAASMPTIALPWSANLDAPGIDDLMGVTRGRGSPKDKNSKPPMREGNKSGKDYPHSSKRQHERMARQIASGWHQTKQLATKWGQ